MDLDVRMDEGEEGHIVCSAMQKEQKTKDILVKEHAISWKKYAKPCG